MRIKPFIAIVFLLFAMQGMAQAKREKAATFSVSGGIGIIHYVNRLKVGANAIDENHGAASFRIMWEPAHRLAIGLETGYYPFYNLSRTSANNSIVGESSLTVIPILLNFRMRVVKNFYLTAGTGAAILLSKTTALGSTAESSQVSLSDFQGSALYLWPVSKKIKVGGELKFFNIGKTEDYAFSLQGIVSYQF